MRFLMVLLLAAAGYYGWGWFQQSQVSRAASKPEVVELFGEGETTPAGGSAAAGSPETKTQPLKADPGSVLLKGIHAGEEGALRRAVGELAGLSGELRQQVALALSARLAAAEGPAATLAVLGEGNGFLHSAEGRQLCEKALQRLRKMAPEERVAWSTRLLVRCAQGPIERSHKEAYAMVNKIYGEHLGLVRDVVCNPAMLRNARVHQVRSGESLGGIARRYRKSESIEIEGWTLCILNQIRSPRHLRADQPLKIPLDPIHSKVFKRSYLMHVYVGEALVRMYWVGHGRQNCTPTETFSVLDKIPEPTWYAPSGKVIPYSHPDNPLGDYFIKLKHASRKDLQSYGVHGTTEPETLRTMASDGCVRMADEDIKELFRLLPRRTRLVIVP